MEYKAGDKICKPNETLELFLELEVLENQADMLNVFLLCLQKDEDVINVNKDKPVQHVVEDIAHQCLEHSGQSRNTVGQSKRHHQTLEVPQRGIKGGFPFTPLTNLD